jgi:hypothetical protein
MSEERVDVVLTELGKVAPPQGMERRIQAAMAEAEIQYARRGRGGWLRALSVLAVPVAVLALIGVGITLRLNRPRQGERTDVARGSVISTLQSPSEASSPHIRLPMPPRHGAIRAKSASATKIAFGYPPPPLPLTAQEKLMLEIIHHGDPEQVAALDPAVREARIYEEHAQFEEFFFPASPPGTPPSEAPPQPTTPQPNAAPDGDKR